MIYNASSIKVLEGLEAVRLRPGMYIGSTGSKGLHHLVSEIVDNSIDEYLAGYGDTITVTMEKDGSVTVEDNGRGIPVDMHEKGVSAERIIMTTLHAGGKFDNDSYKVSGGLHGVGASVVNALSSRFRVTIQKGGKRYEDLYENGGVPTTVLVKGLLPILGNTKKTGTLINFLPDESIFETIEFNDEIIKKRLKEFSFLNKGLKLIFRNRKKEEEFEYFSEEGIVGLLKEINKEKSLSFEENLYFEGKKDGVEVQVAIQYIKDFTEASISYCNNINTVEGGSHVSGLRTAFTRVINQYAKDSGVFKKGQGNFEGRDVRSGMVSIVAIKHPHPQYEGQTKTKLGNSDARSIVDEIVATEAVLYFDRNKEILDKIIEISQKSQHMRKAEEKIRENILNKDSLLVTSSKIVSCRKRKPEETEIFIVEGESAGGCFTGNTLIELADGRKISMKQIVKEFERGLVNFVYSADDGHFYVSPIIDAFLTEKQATIIKVTLNNQKEIRCTPEHRFMLRDGSYKEAQFLTSQDLLMSPCYSEVPDKDVGKSNKAKSQYYAIKVEPLEEREDVYDITVSDYHNFLLEAGVFVHNSAKEGRDRDFQAILTLKGKPLNIERKNILTALKNEEIATMISAFGCGFLEGYGNDFDIKKLKYHKIILMTDADVDGSHIRTLLLTFFYRYMPDLITNGHIYIAMPPLYKVAFRGKETYLYSDNELNKVMQEKKGAISVQRYKGLGEMNPEQLWDTTLNPKTRVLKQVEISDIVDASDITEILMGNSVPPRKAFIENNSHRATIDV